jgi:hypothetical protein
MPACASSAGEALISSPARARTPARVAGLIAIDAMLTGVWYGAAAKPAKGLSRNYRIAQ